MRLTGLYLGEMITETCRQMNDLIDHVLSLNASATSNANMAQPLFFGIQGGHNQLADCWSRLCEITAEPEERILPPEFKAGRHQRSHQKR